MSSKIDDRNPARLAAHKAGEKRYRTKLVCPRCHACFVRCVSTDACVTCSITARRNQRQAARRAQLDEQNKAKAHTTGLKQRSHNHGHRPRAARAERPTEQPRMSPKNLVSLDARERSKYLNSLLPGASGCKQSAEPEKPRNIRKGDAYHSIKGGQLR